MSIRKFGVVRAFRDAPVPEQSWQAVGDILADVLSKVKPEAERPNESRSRVPPLRLAATIEA